ncbi:ribosome quality control complex subunit TCF25-like [Amphiura filiformis]|uniref:ribosome quality control complex subunit TCF25-like n=1 Tax=Amphiura filiformis TaxID=82378 RepID=UPI003B2254C4
MGQKKRKKTEAPQGGAKKEKKEKKKKQKQGGSGGNKDEKQEEDIDATIKEVNELLGPLPNGGLQGSSKQDNVGLETKALLTVEHRFLNPENEMKKIFGAQVIRTEQRRRNRNRQYHRATWLATAKADWPHMGKTGLTMNTLETKAGYHHFTFEHSRDYQQVQFKFLDAVASMNPGNIAAILQINPYHIDSLLQLSDICKLQEDVQMATDLIERALYCFESSFHPLFNLTQGNVRLDYRRPENRSFFIALFRHLTFVGQRGCNRTALEFCKLLLCLDPDGDPLGTLLMIDYYALKSEQYNFLIRLYNEWEAHRNLSQLPNFAFSIALAYFHSSVNGNTSKADDMLQNALIMFPSVLMLLLDKCSIQPDPQVSKHQFFGPANQVNQPAALNQLVALFVGRSFAVWKEPEVVTWLEANVKKVLSKVDKNDRRVKDYKQKRLSRYQGAPRNIYRHILIAEIKDATVNLPAELAGTPVMSYDPLPPKDSITSYERPPRQQDAPSLGRENNVVTEFLRSLMPTYLPPPPGSTTTDAPMLDMNTEQEGAIGGYMAPNTDMRQGITNVMDAMRNLLRTLPRGEGEEEDEEDGEIIEEFD